MKRTSRPGGGRFDRLCRRFPAQRLGKAHVVLGGRKAPVLGRICMDMCMVRVPDGVDVRRGDEVTVFGPEIWTAEDTAEAAGTISYEVICAASSRVPRFYLG